MKKQLLLAVLLCFLTGCAGAAETALTTQDTEQPATCAVGVCLPDETDPYWLACGTSLDTELKNLGYEPQISYAGNDVLLQKEQLREFQAQKVACLVVAGIDSVGLTDVLADVRKADIPVIALDRMLMDTDAVSLCVSFDYKAIGEAMGRFIEEELSLDTAGEEERSHTIEFLMGSPDDPNAPVVHQGVLSALQSYLSSGVLICPSGRTSFEDAWILRESSDKAGQTLLKYLDQHYASSEGFPQIICAGSDTLAQGCIQALQQRNCAATQWPLITGQGDTGDSVAEKKQAMTVRKDLSQLAADCADAVGILLTDGQFPDGFAQTSMDNHAMTVPVRLCNFEVVLSPQEQDSQEQQDNLFPTE